MPHYTVQASYASWESCVHEYSTHDLIQIICSTKVITLSKTITSMKVNESSNFESSIVPLWGIHVHVCVCMRTRLLLLNNLDDKCLLNEQSAAQVGLSS